MASPRERPAGAASQIFGPAFAAEYASLWSQFARRIASGVVRILQRKGVRTGTVVDLGCGPGTLAAHLSARGYQVIGIDRSQPMLSLAQVVAPTARFMAADLRQARLPAADAIVSTFDTLNYLTRAQDLRRLFGRVARALRPGGVFLFDLLTPDELRRNPPEEHLAYRSAVAIVVVEIKRRRRSGRIRHTITTLPRLATGTSRAVEIHEQRVFAPGPVEQWLRAAGFEVRRRPGYPGRFRQAGRTVFVAIRRAS